LNLEGPKRAVAQFLDFDAEKQKHNYDGLTPSHKNKDIGNDSTKDCEEMLRPQLIPRNRALTHFRVNLLVKVIFATVTTYLESKGSRILSKYSPGTFTWKCSYYGSCMRKVNFNLTIYRPDNSSSGGYLVQMVKTDHGNHQSFYTLYKEIKAILEDPRSKTQCDDLQSYVHHSDCFDDCSRTVTFDSDESLKNAVLSCLTTSPSSHAMLDHGIELASGIYGSTGKYLVPSEVDIKILESLMNLACDSECKGEWVCIEAIGTVGAMLSGCNALAEVVSRNAVFTSMIRSLSGLDPFASPLATRLEKNCNCVLAQL